VNSEQASAELQPSSNSSRRPRLRNIRNFQAEAAQHRGGVRETAWTTLYLLLAPSFLLVIGCANVSILLLARGTERQHELAVRAAVGAGRLRMIRQLLTESLGIATTGAALGILFAWGGSPCWPRGFRKTRFRGICYQDECAVLLFSVALAFATAIVFGLWPALQLSRPDIAADADQLPRVAGSVTARRSHGAMVAAQVALTLLMLTAAGAAGKGFLRLVHADLGYDPHNAMSVPIPYIRTRTWRGKMCRIFRANTGQVGGDAQVVVAGISTNATPPPAVGARTSKLWAAPRRKSPRCA